MNDCLCIDGTQTLILQLISFKVRKVGFVNSTELPPDFESHRWPDSLFFSQEKNYQHSTYLVVPRWIRDTSSWG